MKEKILVTGSSGFVGGNLISYLKRKSNYEIYKVSRTIKESHVFNYEELNENIFNKCFAIIHLAGKAHDLKNVSKPEEYFEVNTDLTIKLFDVFLKSNSKFFIYVSSVKASRDFIDEILTEEHLPEPTTIYGKSKLAAEKYILSKKIPPNKKVYILRPCMIHGPNNKGNLNLLYNFVDKKIPYPLGKYSNLRSFLSIDNFCYLVDKMLKSDIDSGIYNVSDDRAFSTIELVSLIGDEINKPAVIIKTPKVLLNVVARIGDVFSLPINSERLSKLTENYIVSNRKIKKALSLKALPLSAELGMRKTINSFKKE